jgi:hypothetical protein
MERAAMNRRGRLAALEKATKPTGMVLHLPGAEDDHAAAWERLLATGRRIGVVHYRGLDDAAVAAFHAAKPQ